MLQGSSQSSSLMIFPEGRSALYKGLRLLKRSSSFLIFHKAEPSSPEVRQFTTALISSLSRGILKLLPTVKKTANNFLYFTDDTYKSVLFTTACSFLFHQSNRLDKGGVRGCAKRRAAIDSAQDWTDQAKHLSSESFLLCIPLDALLTAVYSCLLTTKNGERTAPTTVRPLSIHQTNSMSAKKQVLL